MMPPQTDYTVHPVIRQHLKTLGIENDRELRSYFFPTLMDLPSPELFKSMDKAVALLLEAIENKHEILIWGDYDVDGITATALLVLFFRELGISVKHYIPNRITDGYGLNAKVLQRFSDTMQGNRLLITVDCGIANKNEVREAQAQGFRVIITDHHQVPADELLADATINPKQDDCNFPVKELAGVGIAFYLASALRRELRKNKYLHSIASTIKMKSFLVYVAIGTIADLVPLTGVNRLLTRGGFEVIASSQPANIITLFDALNISHQEVVGETISYQVAPAINAAGRLGESRLPIELLLTQSATEAQSLAADLVTLNEKRKGASRSDLERAMKKVSHTELDEKKCIVMTGNSGDFQDGILGITASRLSETYQVPALVCCPSNLDPMMLKGSGRAQKGFNLYRALDRCSTYLEKFGGHEVAAGFSLAAEHFALFKRCFEQSVLLQLLENKNNIITLEKNYQQLSISEALDPILIDNLLRLEPLGEDNPKPVFVDNHVRFVSISYFGFNKEHIRGILRGRLSNIPFIGFNLGHKALRLDISSSCKMKYSHFRDHYNGKSSWKLKAEDIW